MLALVRTDDALSMAYIAAGAINENISINSDGTLSGAGGGQVQIGQLPGSVAVGQLTANLVTALQAVVAKLSAISAELGNVVISEEGHLRSGQTAYDTGAGFWLGHDGSAPKFSIGNSSGNKLTWDGSTLKIVGEVNFPGRFVALDNSAAEIGRNDTQRGSNHDNTDWVTAHQFTVFGTGTVTVRVSVSAVSSVEVQAPQVRVLRNGTTVVGEPRDFDTGVGIEHAWTIPVSSVDDTFQVQLRSGVQLTPGHFNLGLLEWTSVRARLAHATFF